MKKLNEFPFLLCIIIFWLYLPSKSFTQVQLEPVSRLAWGPSKTHFVTPQHIYIGAGGAVLIGKQVSPDSLQILSYFYLPTIVKSLNVRGNNLFALDEHKGLIIYDISNIYNPVCLSQINFNTIVYDLILDYPYAFVALGDSGIKKVNISNPINPVIELQTNTPARSISKYTSWLYCYNGGEYLDDHLKIISSDNFAYGGTFFFEYFTYPPDKGIYFNNNKGYLLENFIEWKDNKSGHAMFTILDLSNPVNPQRKGHITINDLFYGLNTIGDTVITTGEYNLIFIKASNPLQPTIISQTPNLLHSYSYKYMSTIYPYLYISYDYQQMFQMIKIQNINNPVNGYVLDLNSTTEAVCGNDSILITATAGINFADITDLAHPVIKRKYTNNLSNVKDLKIRDNYLFVAADGLKIYNIHGKDSLSFFSELNCCSPSLVAMDDTLAAIGGNYNGLHLINISNLKEPQYIRSVTLPGSAYHIEDLAFQNHRLFITDYQLNGPVIYDVSNPNQPVLAYTCSYHADAFYVSESDSLLFLGDASSRQLVILNIKNLNNVYEVKRISIDGYSRVASMYIRGNILYIVTYNQSVSSDYLRIYDVSDLQNITFLAYGILPEWGIDITGTYRFAAASDYYDGVYIFDIENLVPVELTTMNVLIEGNSVQLKWRTATERNNKGFDVQRTTLNNVAPGGNQWSSIGFVEGTGTSTLPHLYSFTDKNLKAGNYKYRLKQIDYDGSSVFSSEIDVHIGVSPGKFSLKQNYPNPFNPSTTIKYSNAHSGEVKIKVIDILGREVIVLNAGYQEGGEHQVKFNPNGIPSGTYFYSLFVDGVMKETKKMMYLK